MGTVDKTDLNALSVRVNEIEIHPKYDYMTFSYALALLKTKEDIAYSKLVLPIELPTAPLKVVNIYSPWDGNLKGLVQHTK
ncbi:unnamed protein product [Pieris brassicae]|uniref:Peptidase S1 domain-containing protein n=1 Tax=Pieris brassicae TaxID=7116 RepID=A0A9P0SS46_PIEBR|nr:unnamed protein product [Pieris brassicae]